MTEKTRYSDEELEEFRQIINEKMALAKRDYDQMMKVLMNEDSNDSRRKSSSPWLLASRSSFRD